MPQDFEKIYTRLNVTLTERGESFYNPMLPGVVSDLVDRGIATDSNGATCVFIEVRTFCKVCLMKPLMYLLPQTCICTLMASTAMKPSQYPQNGVFLSFECYKSRRN